MRVAFLAPAPLLIILLTRDRIDSFGFCKNRLICKRGGAQYDSFQCAEVNSQLVLIYCDISLNGFKRKLFFLQLVLACFLTIRK